MNSIDNKFWVIRHKEPSAVFRPGEYHGQFRYSTPNIYQARQYISKSVAEQFCPRPLDCVEIVEFEAFPTSERLLIEVSGGNVQHVTGKFPYTIVDYDNDPHSIPNDVIAADIAFEQTTRALTNCDKPEHRYVDNYVPDQFDDTVEDDIALEREMKEFEQLQSEDPDFIEEHT